MARKAVMQFEGGPFDGMEIIWPEDAGNFPYIVQFGILAEDSEGEVLQPNQVTHYRYAAFHCYEDGPLDRDDGKPENEYQMYMIEPTKETEQ